MRSVVVTIYILVLLVSWCAPQKSDPLFLVRVNNKTGYIDRDGKIVIDPKFAGARDFSEGLASVAVDQHGYLEGYIDIRGNIVIEPKWDTAGSFHEGFAWVGFDQAKREIKVGNMTFYSSPTDSFDYKFGLIDKSGKYVVEPTFVSVGDFSEGLAMVETKDNKVGFINGKGDFAIPPKFDAAGSFSEGLAWVFVNGRYGFIDKTGNLAIKPTFSDARDFSERLACVKIGGSALKPTRGMQVITQTRSDYDHAFIDHRGKIVFRLKASEAHSFVDGLAKFERPHEYGDGFVDKTGRVVIKPQFGLSDFSEGLSFAILDHGKIGFMDKSGKIVLTTNFALADDFKNGLASVTDSLDVMTEKYGYIDKSGQVVWAPTR